MSDFSMKLEGMNTLQSELTALGAELGVKALAQAARQAFKPVLAAARSMVPVDTGDLRDAIKISVVKPSSGETVVVVGLKIAGKNDGEGVPPARRWHWIELGTSRLAAHPFLRPALDQNAAQVVELLKTELVKSIAKAAKKKGGA